MAQVEMEFASGGNKKQLELLLSLPQESAPAGKSWTIDGSKYDHILIEAYCGGLLDGNVFCSIDKGKTNGISYLHASGTYRHRLFNLSEDGNTLTTTINFQFVNNAIHGAANEDIVPINIYGFNE